MKYGAISHRDLRPWILAIGACCFLLSPNSRKANAQQSGHYVQGITGLDNGTGAPPGVYVAYIPYIYDIDSLRGPNGNAIIRPDLTLVAHNVAYQVTTKKKVLGADYGLAVIIPIVNTRLSANFFNTNFQQAGVSDLYFAPVVLGWGKGKASYLLNYGFYAPAGQFDPTSSVNIGLGFWEHQIQAGMGYSFDKKKLWNASALSTWEINHSKSGLDLKPGPMANVEYSFGRRLDQYKINLGVAGYAYKKLSADTGSDSTRLGTTTLDQSFGVGPELKYTNALKHFSFDFRYEKQFGVRGKTQGDVYVISLTWLNIALPGH